MKFQIAFGLILLIIAITVVFIGLPYLLNIIKANQFFTSLRYSPGQGYNLGSRPLTYQPTTTQPSIGAGESAFKKQASMSVYRYGLGQITIRASYFGEGSLNITGWKIKSEKRGEFIIGRGIALPQFSGLEDVLLSSSDSAEIIVGLSPLSNSFRVNGCFGWLGGIYNISTSVSSCPRVELSDLKGLDSACQDLILTASSCRAPSDDVLNRYSYQCRLWVEKNLNYSACVAKNRNNSSFYKEWKIYSGNNNQIFDPLHDHIELRDRAGLLVDSYEY